jgi:hypothetical protein
MAVAGAMPPVSSRTRASLVGSVFESLSRSMLALISAFSDWLAPDAALASADSRPF